MTAAVSTGGTLDESLVYDVMGNISSLTRGGQAYGALSYSYSGNQLNGVTGSGFTSRSYAYDGNGNATSDGGSKSIDYNILNLPRKVRSGTTELANYTYDAAGNKLSNVSTSAGANDGTWEYDNGIVYHNGSVAFISTEEGRAVPNGSDYTYQYNLKDHLGNDRLSFYSNGGIAAVLQEDEYYSFGLRRGLYDNSNNNRYLYNGKEIQTDLANQYDYGARFYDPVIGRWTSVDPLAEKGRRWSPYNYVMNNPLRFIDPDGMAVDSANKNNKKSDAQTGSYTNYHLKGKYHGKGDEARAAQSAKEKAERYKDPHVSTDWTRAENDREAFKDEDDRIKTDEEGHKSPDNYNKRRSPGEKYKEEDKKKSNSEEPDAGNENKNSTSNTYVKGALRALVPNFINIGVMMSQNAGSMQPGVQRTLPLGGSGAVLLMSLLLAL